VDVVSGFSATVSLNGSISSLVVCSVLLGQLPTALEVGDSTDGEMNGLVSGEEWPIPRQRLPSNDGGLSGNIHTCVPRQGHPLLGDPHSRRVHELFRRVVDIAPFATFGLVNIEQTMADLALGGWREGHFILYRLLVIGKL